MNKITDKMKIAAVKAYTEVDGKCRPAAMQKALEAALPFLPIAVEGKETEWHRADSSNGSALLYTLRENGWRKGQPVMVNDVMIRVERGAGSETDLETIIQCILSALSSSPGKDGGQEVEAVAWRCKDFAGGWILYHNEKAAKEYQDATGCLMEALYPQPASTALVDRNRKMIKLWREIVEDGPEGNEPLGMAVRFLEETTDALSSSSTSRENAE